MNEETEMVWIDEPPTPSKEWLSEMEKVLTAVCGRDLTGHEWLLVQSAVIVDRDLAERGVR